MFSVGSAMRVQADKEKSAITKHTLPHGFTIEQNKYLDDYWSLLCRGNFVFQGSIDECFIAFGSHLAGVGK
tara:strand:- start:250 stop:462 length:213 start_codon:yes stop_codon:yes gene_type:complete